MIRFRWVLPVLSCLLSGFGSIGAWAAERPKLVVLLVMDQFRQEYLTRHRASFVPGGFRLLVERGAVFANCHYPYASTLTAPGHAVISTGAYPDAHGIIGNEWFDRAGGRRTTADQDRDEKLLGAEPASPGASPHWLIGSALADELRMATGGRGRVISIAPKARSAILPGGKSANAAYWFDTKTVYALSSTYYMKELPAWVNHFNAQNWAERYAGKPWLPVDNPRGEAFLTFPAAGDAAAREKLSKLVTDSPFLTDVQFAMARLAVENEKLGADGITDLLSLSISATDLVGHDFGADSPRTRDTILRADRSIAEFLRFLDTRVGLANVWIAVSADHGIAPMPEVAHEARLDAGRIANKTVTARIESALSKAYAGAGDEKWVESYTVPHLYLNQALIRKKQLNPADVARRAGDALMEMGGFAAVFTRRELAGCAPGPELIGKVCRGYHHERGGDLYLVFKPFWMYELSDNPKGTAHGTPWSYDTHVPLIFFGAPFRPGMYYDLASPADLAVTMAAALGINAPALAAGRVQGEALNSNHSPLRTPQPQYAPGHSAPR